MEIEPSERWPSTEVPHDRGPSAGSCGHALEVQKDLGPRHHLDVMVASPIAVPPHAPICALETKPQLQDTLGGGGQEERSLLVHQGSRAHRACAETKTDLDGGEGSVDRSPGRSSTVPHHEGLAGLRKEGSRRRPAVDRGSHDNPGPMSVRREGGEVRGRLSGGRVAPRGFRRR